jgi:hypothetical protein
MTEYTEGIEAEFWDEDPYADALAHKTLEAAVAIHIKNLCGTGPEGPRVEFLECLRALTPRSFFAWKRGAVHRGMVDAIAANLAETVVNYELEELLDPNGMRPCDKELLRRLETAFSAVLHEQLIEAHWKPWHCDRVGQVTLTAVQMEAMMREYNPHWF